MKSSKTAQLTEGSVAKILANLTFFMLFGLFGMVAFNLADTYFVGKLGTESLAAMSFTFPVIMIISSVAHGLGTGTSAVVSRAIGEGDHHKVQRLTTDSLSLSLLVVACVVTVGMLTVDPLFRFLGAKPNILPLIRQYMLVWYPGAVAVVVPMVGNNAIRATGDTKTPSMVMLVTVFVNIILDPLLIFGIGPFPKLGIAGAALATVFGRAITLCVAFWILYHREKMITFTVPHLKEMLDSWKKILYIGAPTAATNVILPMSAGIITKFIAMHGIEAVAGYGVATRIEMFAMLAIMAIVAVLSPFVGQNWGAKKYDRVKQGIRCSQLFSMGWGLIMFIFLILTGKFLVSLFNDNPDVVSVAVLYFWIVPIGYGAQGILRLSTITLSVLNRPLHAALLTLSQSLLLYIPLAYLGMIVFGLKGIFGAAALSYIIAGLMSHYWLNRQLETEHQDYLAQQNEASAFV